MGAPVEFLSRRERSRRFGFDCPSLVYYRDWVPGGEYVQTILLKNTGSELQQIKYKLPDSKYFSMRFPDPIRVAAGNSTAVEVTFRPVIYEPYDDCIEFECPGGTFFVRVVATVKQLALALVDCVDFNFVAVNELHTREIEIHNIGELDADFEWRLTGPFHLSPMEGCVPAGGAQVVTISFHPEDASVFVARAMLDASNGKHSQTKEFRCSAIAKYPHLVTAESKLHFEEVLNGLVKHKTFYLKNDSLVPAVFKVEDVESDVDPVFKFQPTSGVIPPEEDCQMKVTYRPTSSGNFSASNFVISTAGGNVLKMLITGKCMGPAVKLSLTNINFGDVHLGALKVDGTRDPPTHKRSFQVINGSDVPVDYYFDASADGMFGFSNTQGSIKPHSYENIIVSFTPRYDAVNFYKRVTCLVKNQGSLFIDLLATAVDPVDKRRPAQLKLRHVHQYHRFLEYGISRCDPGTQEIAVQQIAQHGSVDPSLPGVLPMDNSTCRILDVPDYHQANHGFFVTYDDRRRDMHLDSSACDFEYQPPNTVVGAKTVYVTNRSGHKVICMWMKPPERDGMPPAFEVFPSEKDILPGRSESFEVTFRPTVDNEYFAEMLECVTFPKTTRTFRLVNEDTFCAPLSLMLNVMGHTVPPSAEHFIPKCAFSAERINMPGTLLGGASFQTIRISNAATTPLQFSFESDEHGTWACKPQVGTVRPKEFMLVAVRFTPKATREYVHQQRCTLNFCHDQYLTLIGTGYEPQVHLNSDTDGLYLTPTCVGAISQQKSTLTNSSRIAVHYKFHIPERLSRVIVLDKPEGIILGNNEEVLTWTFAPTKPRLYNETVELDLLPDETAVTGETQALGAPRVITLDVIGDGTASGISFDDAHCDFGAVLVNNTVTKEIWLVNKSACNVTYKLTFDQSLKLSKEEEVPSQELQVDSAPLSYDKPTGVIEARSRKKIICTFAPNLRRFYHFNTYCHAVPDPVPYTGDNNFRPPAPSMDRQSGPLLCMLEMDGVSTYPAIAFADVRYMGLNPVRLWKSLNMDAINSALATEPGAFESQLNTAEGLVGGGGYTGIIDRLSSFDMHLPPAMRKTPSIMIKFKLENQGHLPVEWSMTYPTEKQVEVELWAEAEEPGARELRWMDIVNKKLFSVEPRKGSLQPGESQVLSVVYKFTHIDEPWELPVILQAKKGRRMVLNLVGTTLPPQARLLHFANKPYNVATHVLQPMPIGETNAPMQTVELYNPGTVGAEYEIDISPIEILNQNNYGFGILKIDNPLGSIAAGGYTKVRVLFCPLEAKLYEAKLTVRIIGTDLSWELTLQGAGFHPQQVVGDELLFRNAHSTFPRLPGFHTPWNPTLGSKTDGLRLTGQVARLSHDVVSFGWMPLFSKQHRLVLIENISDDSVTFKWDENDPLLADNALSIWPLEGLIPPQSHVVCKITYHPLNRPELIEGDVVCSVRPEQPREVLENSLDDDNEAASQASATKQQAAQLAAQQAALGHETLMEKQQFVTTVDGMPSLHERNLPEGFEEEVVDVSATMSSAEGRSVAPKRKGASRRGSVMSLAVTGDQAVSMIAEEDNRWKLFLNVEAMAVEPETYRKLHPKFDCALITKDTDTYVGGDIDEVDCNDWSAMEGDLIKTTMCDLMKHVAKDLDVAHAFETVDEKPVPYFCQFSTGRLTPAALRSASALEKVKTRLAAGSTTSEQLKATAQSLASSASDGAAEGEARVAAAPTPDIGDVADVASEALAMVKAEKVHARNIELAKVRANRDELRKLHRDDKFYYSLASILENTMSNLVFEASYQEFDLTKAPRQLVTVVEDEE